MRGEKSFDYQRTREQIDEAAKKSPEKFPFKPGDPVWVLNQSTGEMEEWTFVGWEPNTGKVIVTRGENMSMEVPREKVLKPKGKKEKPN